MLPEFFGGTIIHLKITFDPAKRDRTLSERGLDFADAAEVFAGRTIDIPDERFDYGEARILSIGHLRGRMVIVVWTPAGDARRIISMRKANDREQTRFGQRLSEERLGKG
ncbi:BrnT family toxin [Azospirillum sp. B21]|uniref:BrnT family toxin n=1 Tax=Azospirillum sp. B21 TaxID=2607496 RepID=UPI0020004070|nr:BrnT family toxin [Azospirillum sp. B21]